MTMVLDHVGRGRWHDGIPRLSETIFRMFGYGDVLTPKECSTWPPISDHDEHADVKELQSLGFNEVSSRTSTYNARRAFSIAHRYAARWHSAHRPTNHPPLSYVLQTHLYWLMRARYVPRVGHAGRGPLICWLTRTHRHPRLPGGEIPLHALTKITSTSSSKRLTLRRVESLNGCHQRY